MSAARRNGRRTIFCWCKSACAKAPAAQEKPVRTLSAQKNAGRFAPGSPYIFRALRADAPRKRPHPAQKRSVFLYAVSCCDKCAGKYTVFSVTFAVVPRKGDVDRNFCRLKSWKKRPSVVPRKGDVDRNVHDRRCRKMERQSSPARGTWIEIPGVLDANGALTVVPRKGDVDRNSFRAIRHPRLAVVPRKGDVDRNAGAGLDPLTVAASSPARGTWIEMSIITTVSTGSASSPARGTWIEICRSS